MEDFEMSKVYIKIDDKNRILSCEGGFSISNIKNFVEWIFIDEGYGDEYYLCQSHYFEGGLYTENGICRYKYVGGICMLRSQDEIDADTPDEPIPTPTEDVTWSEMARAITQGVNEV